MAIKKIFRLEAPDGRKIKIKYCAKWSFNPELNHRVDHFEFFGPTSETGYYSHFVHVELKYAPTEKEVIDFCKKFIEEKMGIKYGEPTQQSLLDY